MKNALRMRSWVAEHPVGFGLMLIAAFGLLRWLTALASQQLFGGLTFEPTVPFLLFSTVVFAVLSVGLVGIGLFGIAGVSADRMGWRRHRLGRAVGKGLLGLLLLALFSMAWGMVTALVFMPVVAASGEIPVYQFDASRMLVQVVWGFAIISWQEENLYRGYLQPLMVERYGLALGVVAQAALFSAAHIGFHSFWWQFPSTFMVGLILGWLRGRDGNLIAPFIAHGLSLPLIG